MRGRSYQDGYCAKIEIERFFKSVHYNPLDEHCLAILKFAYNQVKSLEQTAKRTLRSDLDKAIQSAVGVITDVVQLIALKVNRPDLGIHFSKDDVVLWKQKMNAFILQVKEMQDYCSDGLYTSFEEAEEDDDLGDDISSSKIVGVSEVYEELKRKVMEHSVTALVGMPGIGKTALARKLLDDPMVKKRFHCLWVRVGKKCGVKDILRRTLAEMDPDNSVLKEEDDDDDAVLKCWKAAMWCNKRYLIVLDDVWDNNMLFVLQHYYRYGKLINPILIPVKDDRILFTTRLQQDDGCGRHFSEDVVTMRLLNKQESWDLLRLMLFSGRPCPSQLEKAGKKIAENCDGLPLTIVAIAASLSGQDKTPDYWNEVAEKRNHQIFLDAYDGMSNVLLPSYTYLPRLLQMCFLFMGVFPQKQEVLRSKINNLWVVDGFHELNVSIRSAYDADGCLDQLVSNSLVVVYEESTFNWSYSVKTCGLHSSLWHLSNKIAKEIKFCLALSTYNDSLEDDIQGGHHRLSFHNNVLFGIKDVLSLVEDNCEPTVRSLLCFGPYHQYQVPFCYGLKLLRELDALSIRLYEFPIEVLQLVELRYLTLTTGGAIPATISQLSKLQFLIVERHFRVIKSCEGLSYLPVEIWGMKELKHLQITGSDLPDPPTDACLESLSTLVNVGARSCNKTILDAIPNLKELKIRIEVAPDEDDTHFCCFSHNLSLYELKSIKYVIVNPELVVRQPVFQFRSLPKYLAKLSLSGMGYSWNEMSKISSLHVGVMKLKNYAFRGAEWKVDREGFNEVNSLVIEDADLVKWKIGDRAFFVLKNLKMKHCYKLKRVEGEFRGGIRKLEIVHCNPDGVKELKFATRKRPQDCLLIESSWDDLR